MIILETFLKDLTGIQLAHLLSLFEQHRINDLETCRAIVDLLHHDNRFVAEKAFQFLSNRSITDEDIRQAIDEYEESK